METLNSCYAFEIVLKSGDILSTRFESLRDRTHIGSIRTFDLCRFTNEPVLGVILLRRYRGHDSGNDIIKETIISFIPFTSINVIRFTDREDLEEDEMELISIE